MVCPVQNIFIDALIKAIELIITLDDEVLNITIRSLNVTLIALAFATLLGIPSAIILATKQFYGKNALLTIIHTFIGFPPVLAGLLLYLLFSRNGVFGPLDLLYSEKIMILAQFVLALPIIIGLTVSAISQVNPEIREVTQALGASPLKKELTVLNEAQSGLLIAIITAFGRLLGEVGAILIVGGNIRYFTRTLTTSIVQNVQMGEFALALSLGIILLTLSLLANATLTIIQQKNIHFTIFTGNKKKINEYLKYFSSLPFDQLLEEYITLHEHYRQANWILTIDINKLGKKFGDKWILKKIELTIPAGKKFALIGPNGVGKTTLLKIISGLITPTEGLIKFSVLKNETIENMCVSHKEIASNKRHSEKLTDVWRNITYLHQTPVLFSGTCWDNVSYVHGRTSEEAIYLAALTLSLTGLGHKAFDNVKTLSGGEKQLLAISRALTTFPTFIIADEPGANLDPYHLKKMEVLFKKLNRFGISLLFSSHKLEQVKRMADNIALIMDGKVQEVIENEAFGNTPLTKKILSGDIVW